MCAPKCTLNTHLIGDQGRRRQFHCAITDTDQNNGAVRSDKGLGLSKGLIDADKIEHDVETALGQFRIKIARIQNAARIEGAGRGQRTFLDPRWPP